VTTEQELKLAVEAEVVVVDTAVVDEVEGAVVDGPVVGAEVDEVEGDELHAARRMAAVPAAANPTRFERTLECSLIGPLDRMEGRYAGRSVLRASHLCRPAKSAAKIALMVRKDPDRAPRLQGA
jgi:hypothetical protein